MQSFLCPRCGHQSAFDPWKAAARCPNCGYTPDPQHRPADGRHRATAQTRVARRVPAGSHHPYLDELVSHWNGTFRPDPIFQLPDSHQAQSFFEHYQRALGEDPLLRPGAHMRYVRSHPPEPRAILWFVGGYLLLKRGKAQDAAQSLHELTQLYPSFADPWIWLTATTDDPLQRIDLLENAVLLEPAHPLARDALAIALGRVSASGQAPNGAGSAQTTVAKCPQCAGSLHYEPGAPDVTCLYCGHCLSLHEINLSDQQAALVGDLRLQRRYQRHTWIDMERIVHCQMCGAELTMTHHLAKQCIFCGSTSVLVQDVERSLVRPDGFLPFRLAEDQAAAALQAAQQAGLQRLKTWWLGKTLEPVRLQGVYLPFWVFDGFVEMRTSAESRFDRVLGHHPPAARQDLLMFDNLLFSAMDFPPPQLLDRVLPFDLKLLVPFEPHLLANWPAALYHVDVEAAVEQAYDVMLNRALWQAGPRAVSEAANPAQLRRTFQVTSATYQLVLLPVWLAVVQRDDRRLALVNGQTGKVAVESL